MKKRIFYIILGIFLALIIIFKLLFPGGCITALKEGDIIFQTSQSRQSKFVALATMSPKTHCGIIINKNDQLYVLEASNTVRLTPLKQFIDKGLFNSYSVYRYTNKPVNISYNNYLGLAYDSQFSWTNKNYYCSELVWKIYKDQLGIELCKPKPLVYYTTFGLEKVIKKRNINPRDLFVAPSDISSSFKVCRLY